MRPGSRRRTGEGADSGSGAGASTPPPSPGPVSFGGSPPGPPPPLSSPGNNVPRQSICSPSSSTATSTAAPRKWTITVSAMATTSRVTPPAYRRARARWRPTSACGRAGQAGLDLQQRQDRLGGMAARVALVAARAGQRLLDVVDGQHAEGARDAGLQLHVLDAAGAFAADVVVVRGLAADDGAQAHDGRVAPRLRGELGRQRELIGAGHLEDVDGVGADARLVEYAPGARLQAVGELVV